MLTLDWIGNFGYSVLRLSTPLIFAGMAAVISKKAGMMNMALEGMMLCAALGGVVFAGMTGNVWIGLLGAVVIGVLVGAVIAFSSLSGKTDLYLTCIAVNLAATGGTVFVMYLLTGEKATTSAAIKAYTLPTVVLPLINKIPLIGPMLSGHNVLTYLAFISIFAVWFFLTRTRLGLRLRAVGENARGGRIRRHQCKEDRIRFLPNLRRALRLRRRVHVHGLGKLLYEEHGQWTRLHRTFCL